MIKIGQLAKRKPFKKLKARLRKRIRREVCRRDDYRCIYCGHDLLNDFESYHLRTVEHIKPQAKGGTNDPENLACCCCLCNSLKGDFQADTIEEIKKYLKPKFQEIRENYEDERRRILKKREELKYAQRPRWRKFLCLLFGF